MPIINTRQVIAEKEKKKRKNEEDWRETIHNQEGLIYPSVV